MKRGAFIVMTILSMWMLKSAINAQNNALRTYGMVTKSLDNHIKGALVEKVALYPKKDQHSHHTIERDALLLRYKNAIGTVLICHGFMCNKFDVGFLRDLFPRGKYNVMTFDFRAHGEKRNGQYCTFGKNEAYDVIAAAQFIKQHPDLKDKPLIVYGFSMGAVAAIEAEAKALEHADGTNGSLFAGMILDCPFDSAENVIKQALDNTKFSLFGYEFNVPGRGLLQKYAFHPYIQTLVKAALRAVANLDTRDIEVSIRPVHTAQSAKKITTPCFFIHCRNDKKVPVQAVINVFNNVKGYKKLWITNGRYHFDSFFYNPERYAKKVRSFLAYIMSKRAKPKKNKIVEDDADPIGT